MNIERIEHMLMDVHVADVYEHDAPEFVGAWIDRASWIDGKELTYDQLDLVNSLYPDYVNTMAMLQLMEGGS